MSACKALLAGSPFRTKQQVDLDRVEQQPVAIVRDRQIVLAVLHLLRKQKRASLAARGRVRLNRVAIDLDLELGLGIGSTVDRDLATCLSAWRVGRRLSCVRTGKAKRGFRVGPLRSRVVIRRCGQPCRTGEGSPWCHGELVTS